MPETTPINPRHIRRELEYSMPGATSVAALRVRLIVQGLKAEAGKWRQG